MEKVKCSKIIDLAKSEVIGFAPMYKKLEQKVILGGLSYSTLLNYGRCIAKICLHFKVPGYSFGRTTNQWIFTVLTD